LQSTAQNEMEKKSLLVFV